MADLSARIDGLSPLKRALLTIEELEARLESADARIQCPVAVIGIGCRFPGQACNPDGYWRMLQDGVDGTSEVPPDRWDVEAWYDPDRSAPGKTNIRRAGFLAGVDRFDPRFFGIAPREAVSMDPQHRLLLEVVWEALEHGGLVPASLEGSSTGVFVGLYNNNYTLTARGTGDPRLIDAWSASGGHTSIAPGRVSYLLGLSGPSLAIDTACSSSLVATHVALQSLAGRECDMAIAGGVHLLLFPRSLVASTKLGATSADGRCKAFDEAADGFGHGEGCGVVVLKRLDDALAAGDRVLAVIRGSAVNQDGRSSSLTAPNGKAQEAVVRAALARAGIEPRSIGYVEAHGTGTALGDPIEANALSAVLGDGRDRPLVIGSVKTNIGHLEAAAGIAGLVKVVLALGHRQIPPHLQFRKLNPHIETGACPLEIPVTAREWKPIDGRLIAGVSAFGFGGTNAHVIVEAPPEIPSDGPARGPGGGEAPASERSIHVLAISARDETALAQLRDRWVSHLGSTGDRLEDLCFTATTARTAYPVRLAVVASDKAQARSTLGEARFTRCEAGPRVGFLFTGQGSQYAGMGRALEAREPRFAAALDRCSVALEGRLGRPLRELMFASSDAIDRTENAQVALFCLEYALAELVVSWGVEPVALLGHSLGEYVAAVVGGSVTLEEGARLVCERARLMQALPAGGAMTAVFAGEARVVEGIARAGTGVSVAAVNGPESTVLSGALDAVARTEEALRREGIRTHRLNVSHAFHSQLVEAALPGLERAAERIEFSRPSIPIVGNVTGTAIDRHDASYWVRHARQTVRFADGLKSLESMGCDLLVEIGPHPVLLGMAQAADVRAHGVASMRRGGDEAGELAKALASLWSHGVPVDWPAYHSGRPTRRVSAPTYPFQRQRYWLDDHEVPGATEGVGEVEAHERSGGGVASGSPVVYDFYDDLTVLSGEGAEPGSLAENHLTFGFLPDVVAGFSWLAALFKNVDPGHRQRLVSSQRKLKEALLGPVDFSGVRRVLDFGCGHAADLCSLAIEHPHLQLCGFTVSARQVEVGRERARRLGVDGRVGIQRADSAHVAFPGTFDVILGFEVSGLIEDKHSLFSNVGGHLANGGVLVIADFIAVDGPIANPETHSYTSTAGQWAELLTRNRLRVVQATDASREVANWLHDPSFAANLERVVREHGFDDLTRRHLASNDNIGKALRANVMKYALIHAQKDPFLRESQIARVNSTRLSQLTPYSEVRPERVEAWRTWLYAVEREPVEPGASAEPAAGKLAEPEEIARQLAGRLEEERATVAALVPVGVSLDELSVDYIVSAFRDLGCKTVEEARRLAVVETQRRLHGRLIDVLVEAGLDRLPAPADVEGRRVRLREGHPEARAELELLGRCGARLAGVLSGRADPLQLLFPDGDASDAEALYERSPFSAAVGRLVGDSVARAISGLGPSDRLRVLEIGGGTGGTTSFVVDRLPADRCDYVFTDVSPTLLARAGDKFESRRFVRFERLDIGADPDAQGFEGRRFDLVLAANVLHATPSLEQTLANVRRLLEPGGLLVLVETTGKLRWGDLTFGLTDGMWCFVDAGVRPDYALLTQAKWLEVLGSCGFEGGAALCPGEPDRGGIGQQSVFVARAARSTDSRSWWIVGDPGGLGSSIAAGLRKRGDRCVITSRVAEPPQGTIDEVVSLAALEANDPLDPGPALGSALELTQRVAGMLRPPRLTLVTRGAQVSSTPGGPFAGDDAQRAGLAQSTVTGFCRVVAVEHPEVGCRTIDLDGAGAPVEQVEALIRVLDRPGETEIAIGRGAWAPRLSRCGGPSKGISFDPDRGFLITGGLGGLGLVLARWMVSRGARRIVLMARSAPGPDAVATLRDLQELGARVATVRGDVSVRDEVVRALAMAREGVRSLGGVFQCAGVLDDGIVLDQSWERFRSVLGPKVHGAWHLHELTRGDPIDWFVLFSSAAGLFGSPGQSNHAAANTFLDALALFRRSLGLPAIAIEWGAWASVGAAARPEIAGRVGQLGIRLMEPARALEALEWAMGSGRPQVAVVDIDWAAFLTRFPAGREPSLLRRLRPAEACPGRTKDKPSGESFADRIASVAPAWRRDFLMKEIAARAARVMGLEATEEIGPARPLRELGLDSLMSVELRNVLAAMVGVKLPATLLFDHPTVESLGEHFVRGALARVFPAEAPSAPAGPDDLEGLDATRLSSLLDEEIAATQRRTEGDPRS